MVEIEKPRYQYTEQEKQTLRYLLEEILEQERDFGVAENAEVHYEDKGFRPVINRTTFCLSIERVKSIMPGRLVETINEI